MIAAVENSPWTQRNERFLDKTYRYSFSFYFPFNSFISSPSAYATRNVLPNNRESSERFRHWKSSPASPSQVVSQIILVDPWINQRISQSTGNSKETEAEKETPSFEAALVEQYPPLAQT